jgi:putative DNA primase/helicase
MSALPFAQIKAAALANAQQLLFEWFPAGKVIGHEFKIGNIHGEPGKSLCVNLNTGTWADFAGVEKGADLIDLLAAIRHRGDIKAAALELAGKFGIYVNGYAAPGAGSPTNCKSEHKTTKTPKVKWQPLVPPPLDAPRPPESLFRGFDAVFDYTDLGDRVTHYVGRIEERNGEKKKFIPITYGLLDGVARWEKLRPDHPLPLYGLNRLVAFPDATVILCEGEKSADAAQVMFPGNVCMSWCAGTGSVDYADLAPIQSRNVIIWPDADEAGIKAAHKLAKRLPYARMVCVDGLPSKFDAADLQTDDPDEWLAQRLETSSVSDEDGGPPDFDPEDFADGAYGAYRDAPMPDELNYRNGHDKGAERPDPPNQSQLVLNPAAPLESAKTFIERNYMVGDTRTIHHQNSAFFAWDAGRYIEMATEEMRANIYKFLGEAGRIKGDGIVPFDPNRSKVLNVLEATSACAQLPTNVRAPVWLNSMDHPSADDLIACSNGLLHLPTRQLTQHTPAFFTLNALDFAYDPDAPTPANWLKFLHALWGKDEASIAALQEMFGLLLTGETRHQKAFLIVGPKRSGKGTLARIVTRLLGQANVCGPTLSGLGQNFGLAPLIGKRLAIISDARLGAKNDQQVIVERILAITGEDSLTIDRKFRDGWTGKLETRFLILSNELPRLGDASGALASRFIILMLRNSFFGKEDLGLTDRLVTELPGILNWALDGWDRLKQRGHFVPPPSAAEAQQEMEDLGSPIGAFLRERCTIDAHRCVECDRLFDAWVAWCRDNNRDHPGTVQGFGRDLRAAVPALDITRPRNEDGSRSRYYQGLDLELGQ